MGKGGRSDRGIGFVEEWSEGRIRGDLYVSFPSSKYEIWRRANGKWADSGTE